MHAAILLAVAALPLRAHAEWWSSKPVDYEDCIEKGANTATTADAKAALTSQCDAKFPGRRKPGGGYTYFDFMQNRSFDIAGPSPTTEELRKMDEQYTEFLDQRRRQLIAAAFAEKQRQQAQIAALQTEPPRSEPVPQPKPRLAVDKPLKPAAKPKPRTERSRVASKPRNAEKPTPRPAPKFACDSDPVSCGLNQLSAGFSVVKKSLFGAPAKKRRHGAVNSTRVEA
ncbi:hypothetical protein [Rhodopseudomonas sp. B29]|uniref:hypothetical protein n=1 Tax=Rhodopseudomonas sp. B29 TaxID=95607 RepID=UPI001FCC439A|nr:hypothetical protein [Rhodopseudomonas sp. B29]